MRRIYQFTLYLDTEIAAPLVQDFHLAERIAQAVMAALPMRLSDGVRLRAADATHRGKSIDRPSRPGAGRRRTASRRLLPG